MRGKRQRDLTFKEKNMIQAVRNAAYHGSGLIEKLEQQKIIFGNGHHKRQSIECFAGATSLGIFFPNAPRTYSEVTSFAELSLEQNLAAHTIETVKELRLPARCKIADSLLREGSTESGILSKEEQNTDVLTRDLKASMYPKVIDVSLYSAQQGYIVEEDIGIRVYQCLEEVSLFACTLMLGARATQMIFNDPELVKD